MPSAHTLNASPRRLPRKWWLLVLVICVVAVGYWQFHGSLRLEWFAEREGELREFEANWPWAVPLIAFLVYTVVTGMSLPGATALTLVVSWYLGFWKALPVISFASTAGATIAMLMSRYFFRDWVHDRFGERIQSFNESLEKDGAFYLLSLRLIPAIPFFAINAVMGLTPIRTRTFWWVSQLGMLPGSCIYIYAGSSLPDLGTLADQGIRAVFSEEQWMQMTIALILLASFPLASRWLIRRLRFSA
jgi:uncharacterized membrane protein YdjX (TVP38/TMEM64 family)